MTKLSTLSTHSSESIDAIIDAVAADPRQASYAKTMLRGKIQPEDVLQFPVNAAQSHDDDDMWDNMPV